jgi:hypothetical protein
MMTKREQLEDLLRSAEKEGWLAPGDRLDIMNYVHRGPDWITNSVWICDAHSGLSPFAMAGISNTSPRRVMKRLAATRNCSLQLGFCSTTYLPILFRKWGALDGGANFSNYHEEDMMQHFMDEAYDCEDNPEKWAEEETKGMHLRDLMREYGGASWRRYCTRDFNPFDMPTNNPTPKMWLFLKKVWKAADAAYKEVKRNGHPV